MVAIDYMTKWAEAKAMRIINQQDCIKFIDSILMRFGIPVVLVSDNGPPYIGSYFEVSQRDRNKAQKVLCGTSPGKWASGGTGKTPFKLDYGSEAWLPMETGSPSHKVIHFDKVSNIEGPKTNMELLDEVRDRAVQKMEKYKEKTNLYFGKKAKIIEYEVGELVLQYTKASDLTNQDELQPNREGPYKVKEVLRPGTYKMSYLNDTQVPNTWNRARLR
ncbi:uncharacterized protein LOC141719798 [Apium graveolens]|uniref:uncharacterized protein LOC141719798 n=1 Tax=Apium graveolens TaxID=4045 RepID=UPI003D7A9FA0